MRALELIGERIGTVEQVSRIVETAPEGFVSQNRFLNAAVRISTALTPLALLGKTQEIERLLGRRVKSRGGVYHDREIDIDILLYGDRHIETEKLTIPHKEMYHRRFVMEPLKEVLLAGGSLAGGSAPKRP